MVSLNNALATASNAAGSRAIGDWLSLLAAGAVNVLSYIPTALHSDIRNYVSTTDVSAYVQAAINAAPSVLVTSGSKIVAPPGLYIVQNIAHKDNVELVGAGFSTEFRAAGTSPVFLSTFTSGDPLNGAGLRDCTIRGGGKANSTAHGVSWAYTNRCRIENVQAFSCRYAFNLGHQWQLGLKGAHAHGAGGDQNYIGFYLEQSSLAFIDNAVIAEGCVAQQCEYAGYRIINGQGSKWSNCEAGACAYGWYVANPVSGTVQSQWMHFDNCLSDSCTTENWYFERGTATSLGQIIMTGTWTGNSTGSGITLVDATDFHINGIISILTQTEAIKVVRGSRVLISEVLSRQYNNANGGSACVTLEDSFDCNVVNVVESSTNARLSVLETGTSDRNGLGFLSGQPTLVGDNSYFFGAQGAYGFLHKRTGNAAIGIIGGAANVAYIGLGTEADPLLHFIARTPGSDIEVFTNGGRRWQFGDGSGEAGFVNTTDMPFQVYRFATVASLPAWTTRGRLAWVDNGRNSGEGAAAGTGCLVNSTASGVWFAVWSGLAVTA